MAIKNKNEILEKLAFGIEGLVMHSTGMKREFHQNKLEHLLLHCKALKGFIKDIEENAKKLERDSS